MYMYVWCTCIHVLNIFIQLEVSGSGAEQFLESVMVADLKSLHVNAGSNYMYMSVITCTYIHVYILVVIHVVQSYMYMYVAMLTKHIP